MNLLQELQSFPKITQNTIDQLLAQGYAIKDINKALNQLEESFVFCFVQDEYLNTRLNQIDKGIYTKSKYTEYIDHKAVSIKHTHTLMNGDLVLYQTKKGIVHILSVLKRSVEQMYGYVFFSRKKAYFNPLMPNLKKVYPVVNQNSFKLNTHYRAVFTDDSKTQVKLVEEVANLNQLENKVNAYLEMKHVRNQFNRKIQKELQQFKTTISTKDYPTYKDMTTEYFFTIDGANAKDFDDAVSLQVVNGKYRLKVAIADVSHYVQKGSAIDQEACKRGTSIYFLNRVIPMLPFELADDLCSLKPHVNRLALVLSMDIEEDSVVDYQINRAIICSKHRLTYDEVNQRLQDGDSDLDEILKQMNQLAKKLRQKRYNQGAISFKEDELSFVLEQGKVIDIQKRERFDAEYMIEDFMLLANETIANHMQNLELPMVYRNHDHPKLENLEQYIDAIQALGYDIKGKSYQLSAKQLRESLAYFENHEAYDVLSDLLLRSMAKANYEAVSNGHFALTFEHYTHFTSPIRRYPDLLVHRLIHKYVLDHQYTTIDQDEQDLQLAITTSNTQEKLAVDIERQVSDLAISNYMSRQLGKVFTAKVVSITSFGFFVRLENGARGLVHLSNVGAYSQYDETTGQLFIQDKELKLGSDVTVKLIFVDEFMGKLDFRLVWKKGNRR